MKTESVRRWFEPAAHLPFKLLSAAVLVGLVAGGAGVGLRHVIGTIGTLVMGGDGNLVEQVTQLPWYWKLAMPAIGGALVAPMVYTWVKEARGHGVPEVMEAVALNQGRIRGRVAVVKSLASTITISSGGSVGSEGPVVQIGAAIGSKIGQVLGLSSESVISLVGCGVAGGIAAVFNAPIAGAFFSLEVILGNFAASSFAPIVISSVTATAVSRAFLGDFPAFKISHYMLESVAEIPIYAVLGIAAALISIVFTKVMIWVEEAFERSGLHPYLRAVIGGLIVGACFFITPQVFGTGFDTMTEILLHDAPVLILALLLPIKILATSVTLGSGGSGGIFTPSLFLGAVLGSLFGTAVNAVVPAWTAAPGAYALVGMGAMLAGTTHTPITAILLLFEITGDYQIILPLMVACVIATLISNGLHRESIYTAKLAKQGISLRLGREEMIMRSYRVQDVMRPSSRTVSPGTPLKELVTVFLASRDNERYVVDNLGRYMGFISLNDIKEIIGEETLNELVVAGDIAHRNIPAVAPIVTLSNVMDCFLAADYDRLPVVDNETGQFLGTISEHDVISLYNREILKKDFLGTVRYERAKEEGGKKDFITLPSGYHVEMVRVPEHFIGKSLREIDLRARFKLSVVAIQHAGQEQKNEIPNAELPLQPGDALVVVGNDEDIDAFRMSKADPHQPAVSTA